MYYNSYDDYKLASPYDDEEEWDKCPSCGNEAEHIENDLCECCAVRCSGCEEYVEPEKATANVTEESRIMPILCDSCIYSAMINEDCYHFTTIIKSNHNIT